MTVLVLLMPIFLIALPARCRQKPAAAHSTARLVRFRNALPGVAYVGSKTCAECHPDIYDSFIKTDMGHSMSLPGEWANFGELQAPVRIKHPKANRYYEVYRRGSELYQSEYELDAEGGEIFRDEHKIDYVVGAGANGLTFIVRRGDFLFEAPLSYYSRAKAWDLSPGYKQGDYGFNRPIPADCIQCHSGRPQPVENTDGRFKNPLFLELPIGCENCHGPGALHVEERRKAAPLAGNLDRSIVNPAKLPGWLADNICMYCHQGADARPLMPGKSYGDFRPGAPLTDTLAIFAVPFDRHSPPQEPLLQHFALMSLSQCYLKSGGKMSCITCHDPHHQPVANEAPAYFRSKCLTCHNDKSCMVPLKVRLSNTPPDNCVGCHMPKQSLREISHSSLTDHRIPARPGEPLPEIAFHLTTPELPDLVHLDAVPKSPTRPIPPVTLFRAYGELVASYPQYITRFNSLLDLLAQSENNNAFILSSLARRKMNEGTTESAAAASDYFQQAVRAGSTDTFDIEQVATVQEEAGRTQDAIATVIHGLTVNPYSPRLYRLLAALYISAKEYNDALKTMKKDLALFPEDSFIRSLLKKAESGNAPGPPGTK